MPTVYDVPINDLISKAADQLKALPHIKPPVWSIYVKTGMHKERPPQQQDWWYIRAAAVLLTVRKKGPIGVSKLRTKYGGRKDRGHKPEKFFKGSGSILRKVLQQLEKSELVKQVQIGVHKGRVVTPKGMSFLDSAAVSLYKKRKSPAPAQPVPKEQQAAGQKEQ